MLCDKTLLNSHPTAMVCTCAMLESANTSKQAEEMYTIPSTIKNGIKLALLTINAIQYHHHYHRQHNHFLPPFSSFISFFKCSYSKALYPLYCLFLSLSLSLSEVPIFNKVIHLYHYRLAKTS